MKHVIGCVRALMAGSAMAHGCPGEMKAIDARLSNAKLTEAQMKQVKELRSKGEQLHKDGKHTESMAALAEAKKLIGP